MIKRRIFIYSVAIFLFFGISLGVILPWGIGQALQNQVMKRLVKLESLSHYQCRLKKYDRSLFRTKATIEITTKPLLNHDTPIHVVIEENIQHGPILFDRAKKKFLFNLAKINTTLFPQNTDFIQFDQKEISLSSLVNYRWKENFQTEIPKISGVLSLKNHTPFQFELHHVMLKGNLGFSTLNLLQDVQIKELILSRNQESHIKMQDIEFHNHFVSLRSVLDNSKDHFKCAWAELQVKKNKWVIQNPSIQCIANTESNQNLLEMQAKVLFDTLVVNDKVYGPLESEFVFQHVPKVLVEASAKLENMVKGKQNKELSSFLQQALAEEPLNFVVKTFHLHVPGGNLALKGNYKITPNSEDALMPFYGKGKLIAEMPKIALSQLLTKTKAETIANSFFIEVGDKYHGYFLLNEKGMFINGSNAGDYLFNNQMAAFTEPLTKEQQLLLALFAEDNESIQTLLKDNVKLNAPLIAGKYPIHLAAYLGNQEGLELFLLKGQTPDLVDNDGNTPLYWAARAGHNNIVNTLLHQHATINVKNKQGWTPLQEASENGHSDIVSSLIEKGAKINTQDNEGRTALFWAAKEGHADIIKLLLEKGADPCIFNVRKLTPLDIAKEYQRKGAINLLGSCEHCGHK